MTRCGRQLPRGAPPPSACTKRHQFSSVQCAFGQTMAGSTDSGTAGATMATGEPRRCRTAMSWQEVRQGQGESFELITVCACRIAILGRARRGWCLDELECLCSPSRDGFGWFALSGLSGRAAFPSFPGCLLQTRRWSLALPFKSKWGTQSGCLKEGPEGARANTLTLTQRPVGAWQSRLPRLFVQGSGHSERKRALAQFHPRHCDCPFRFFYPHQVLIL